MNRIFAYSLLFVISIVAFRDVFTIVNFKANQEYVASALCINRNKPELKCNGKCILMQKLKLNRQKEDSKSPIPKFDELKQVVFILEETNLPSISNEPIKLKSNFNLNQLSDHRSTSDIFHPPQFI